MRKALVGMVFGLLIVLSVEGADIFSDDFSNCAQSNINWSASSALVTASCKDGVYKVTNAGEVYLGLMTHQFAGTAPSTFTITGKITRTAESINAGYYFCMSINSGSVNGYTIQLSDDNVVYVYRHAGPEVKEMYMGKSAFLSPGTNELTISKKDGAFNIFTNGHFVGSFTDGSPLNGFFGLLVPPEASAVFDDILVTDQFKEATPVTCFSDDFETGPLMGWITFGSQAQVSKENGKLNVKTTNGAAYIHTNINLQNFIVKTDVVHRAGSSDSLYGILLVGPPKGNSMQFACFVINGSKRYGTIVSGKTSSISSSGSFGGVKYVDEGTGEVTYYINTLEVVKKEGDPTYSLLVNGITMSVLDELDFEVVGVGIAAWGDLELQFDNFVASEGTSGECSVVTIAKPQYRPFVREHISTGRHGVYDPLGRLINRTNIRNAHPAATGVYIDQSKINVELKNKRK